MYDLKDVWHLQLHLLSIAPGNDPLSIAYYVMDSPLKDWSTLDSLAIDSGLAQGVHQTDKLVREMSAKYLREPRYVTISRIMYVSL